MQGLTANLVSGAIGALLGAYVVHLLTKARETASWVRNIRMKEWQELLESITKAYMALLSVPNDHHGEAMGKWFVSKGDALANVDIMLATRIFISDDVGRLDVRKQWAVSVDEYHRRGDKPAFKAAYQALHKEIVGIAKIVK